MKKTSLGLNQYEENDLFNITGEDGLNETIQIVNDVVESASKKSEICQKRMDTLIPSGVQTEGNTELIDIRTGANGTIYPNAGESVRGQYNELNTKVNVEKKRVDNLEINKATKQEVDVERKRVDLIVQTNTGVGTEENAELIDIRVDADGKIYNTAGNAVRKQIGKLKETLNDMQIEGYGQRIVHRIIDLTSIATKHENEYFDKNNKEFIKLNDWEAYELYVLEGEIYHIKGRSASSAQLFYYLNASGDVTYMFPNDTTIQDTEKDIVIPSNVSKIIVNRFKKEEFIFTKSNEFIKYEFDYDFLLLDKHHLSNKLIGLKLVTAGDSITEGLGIENANTDINLRPTYGYLAKDYYNMKYLNISESGKTMADIKVNGVSRNGFAVERYALVPDDTDVLTIWFGWNDGAYGANSMRDDYCLETYGKLFINCTEEEQNEAKNHSNWFMDFLGTVDSTDTKTWCGAWNFVLNYFTVTKPIERLGVIVPYFPINDNYSMMREKLIELCKLYGVSYIDAMNTKDIPSIGYSTTLQKNANALKAKYTADSTHPNTLGYERIARGYIPWLKTL